MRTFVLLLSAALLAAAAWFTLHSTEDPPSEAGARSGPTDGSSARPESAAEQGSAPERRLESEGASRPDAASETGSLRGPRTAKGHRMTVAEFEQAKKSLLKFTRGNEDNYLAAVKQGEDAVDVTIAALRLAKYDAAMRMLENGRAWAFLSGPKAAEEYNEISRKWDKVILHNAAPAESDPSLGVHLVFALDPEDNPDIQALKEQLREAKATRSERIADRFNDLPLALRRQRIAAHDEAVAELASAEFQQLSRTEREARRRELKEQMIRGRLRIDRQNDLLIRTHK